MALSLRIADWERGRPALASAAKVGLRDADEGETPSLPASRHCSNTMKALFEVN